MSVWVNHAYSILNSIEGRKELIEKIQLLEDTLLKENIVTQRELLILQSKSTIRQEYFEKLNNLKEVQND
jgi:hypothetical protein